MDSSKGLFCICRQPESRFMICCDQCGEWFHGDCIGITEAEGDRMDKDDISFICNQCQQTCNHQSETELLPKWHVNGPSFRFFPYPVIDVNKPWGSPCDSCGDHCTGHFVTDSSIGDGGFDAFLRNCAQTKPSPILLFSRVVRRVVRTMEVIQKMENYMIRKIENPMIQKMENYMIQKKNGKLYDFTNLSAFKCSHQLDMNESSNDFHILRSHFKFTYSVAFSENYGSVTFSENRKSMMSYHRDFPVL